MIKKRATLQHTLTAEQLQKLKLHKIDLDTPIKDITIQQLKRISKIIIVPSKDDEGQLYVNIFLRQINDIFTTAKNKQKFIVFDKYSQNDSL